MDSTRQKKIGRLVQREMSEIFQREVRDVVMGTLVSVTVARVSSDLGLARIYISIFPAEHKDELYHGYSYLLVNTLQVGRQLHSG